MDFNLKQLEVFVCVAECGSFTLAAERLYLSQPTVSSHIAGLEAALGVPLLERSRRKKVTLTEKGQEILRRCKLLVASCHELQESCEVSACSLRLGASTVPNEYILPGLMAAFRRENPRCRFLVRKGNSAAVHELMAAGQLQLGFVGTVLDPERYHYRKLCEDSLVLITPDSPEYRLLKKQGVYGRTLLDRPILERTPGSGTQRAVSQYLRARGLAEPPVAAQIEGSNALLQSVSQGLGNAVLSAFAARDWQDRVLQFPLEQEPVTRQLYVCYPADAPLSALAERFLAFTQRYAETEL